MKRQKIISFVICFVVILSLLLACASCGAANNVKSDTLYVKKVNNLPRNFVMGMDASSVISLENSGVKFYDFDGNESDVFKTLSENGINTIRVRVWNDPFDSEGRGYGGGNNDIETAVKIGKRATEYNMNLMVDFHYSDFWADPSKQQVPKAWEKLNVSEKADALYDFTKESLERLKAEGIKVNIVQVGNETNAQMCGETTWRNVAMLMNAGAKAVRKVLPKAQVALHFANPEKTSNYREYAAKLQNFNVDYDIFASSYYPYWHGTLDNLSLILGEIAEQYDKKVMVAETSYAYTVEDSDFFGNTISESTGVEKNYPYTIQGQANCIRDVIDTVANTKNGIGVCYWEGTWITVGNNSWEENYELWQKYGSGWTATYSGEYDSVDAAGSCGGSAVDNQAFFDKNGKPIESLKVFALARKGNEITAKADALEDAACSFIVGDEIELPKTVNAVMSDNSKQPQNVVWNATAEQLTQISNSDAGKYTVTGSVDGQSVKCIITMKESNLLNNGGFEENDNGETSPTNWTVTNAINSENLKILITNENPWEGNNAFHWWSAQGNVNFSLEQQVSISKAGKFKLAVRVIADKNQTITAYVKINGQTVGQATLVKDGYQSDPDLWQAAGVEFDVASATTVTVGISVNCADSGTWGDIDDFVLSKIEI